MKTVPKALGKRFEHNFKDSLVGQIVAIFQAPID